MFWIQTFLLLYRRKLSIVACMHRWYFLCSPINIGAIGHFLPFLHVYHIIKSPFHVSNVRCLTSVLILHCLSLQPSMCTDFGSRGVWVKWKWCAHFAGNGLLYIVRKYPFFEPKIFGRLFDKILSGNVLVCAYLPIHPTISYCRTGLGSSSTSQPAYYIHKYTPFYIDRYLILISKY